MSVLIVLFLLAMAPAVTSDSGQLIITVGHGEQFNYTSIQDAVNSVPANNGGKVVISLAPGIYREKIVINKPNITLIGRGARSTIVTCNERWVTIHNTTVSVLASDFVAKGITFENTYGSGTDTQAIAMTVKADRVAFYQCSFLSFQDTLLDDVGRHYYHRCYIQGGTDFICGNGKAFFEECHLHSTSTSGGAFTAQRRMDEGNDTGYTACSPCCFVAATVFQLFLLQSLQCFCSRYSVRSFVGCSLTGIGVGTSILGRPWGPYSRVVFALSNISNTVNPVGWNDWGTPNLHKTVYYGEYKCSGKGSGTNGRVPWARQLSHDEAKPFLTKAWVGGDWIKGN